MTPSILDRRQHLPVLLVGALVFLVAYTSPVSYEGLDAHPTLLVSQSILEHGTTQLDAYRASGTVDIDLWSVQAPNGHFYYYWPVGPSALSVPYVWLLNRIGVDMTIVSSNHHAQNLLSAVLCVAVFFVLYQLGRCFLGLWPSLSIATVSVLGSSLVSTVATALWNIDFTVLFVALSLLVICRSETGQARRADPYVLGVCLFGAFFCRPTAATFIAVVLVYLLLRSRETLPKTAATAGVFLALFVFWSWAEHGTLLPVYYSTGRFGTYPLPVWLALYAHLASPSRGILTFSPFFVPVLLAAAWLWRVLKRDALFVTMVAWLVLHLIVASNAERWWGGHSFGPRLDTEVIPALVLITILAWREMTSRRVVKAQRAVTAAYLSLGLVAIWINAGQGLYNQNTLAWNGGLLAPEVDTYPDYLLDWRYPQFLATNHLLCERNLHHLRAYDAAHLDAYHVGDAITYASGMDEIPRAVDTTAEGRDVSSRQVTARGAWRDPVANTRRAGNATFVPTALRATSAGANALFIGWSAPEVGFRWTTCRTARILFRLASTGVERPLELELLAGSFGAQDVDVFLNDALIGTLSLHSGPALHTLPFDGAHLVQPGINVVEFRMPDAVVPENPLDPRLLGVQLLTLRVRYASEGGR